MRGERRFGRQLPLKPVELGKEYDADIQDVSRMGQGIARIKGFVIFVPDTRPGDRVMIKITRISRDLLRQRSLEKLYTNPRPSNLRVKLTL